VSNTAVGTHRKVHQTPTDLEVERVRAVEVLVRGGTRRIAVEERVRVAIGVEAEAVRVGLLAQTIDVGVRRQLYYE